MDQARDVLPSQLSRADEVLADADAARSAAQAEADAVLAQARAQAAALVEQEAVVVAAQERAAQIVAEAEETAERLQRDADDYCDRRLADFEIDLGKVLSQVQAGRAKLAGRLGRRARRGETCATRRRIWAAPDLCRRVVRWFCRSWHGPRSTRGPWPCSALFTSIPVRRSCSIRTSSADVRDRRGPCSAPWAPRRISVPT